MSIARASIEHCQKHAALFSGSLWRSWLKNDNKRPVRPEQANAERSSLRDYLEKAYGLLEDEYRNEYVYKNTIINQLWIDFYGLNDTVMLNEFRINKSVADLVMINQNSTVFEIKTELDTTARLATQVNDYLKLFRQVYVVTHESLENKYLKTIGEEIGVMILTDQMKLQTTREARTNYNLDPVIAIKSLRKQEYSNIIQAYFGELPAVSDFSFFRTCKELFKQMPAETLHKLMCRELSKRQLKAKKFLTDNAIPQSIKHVCHSLDLSQQEYARLKTLLHKAV